jgi:DNA-binding SARP family transcriptional activator/predicted ATPase
VAHLSLSLLGPFQVTLHGEPVTGFESSKVRALLAYLAVEASQHPEGHPRAVLAGLLWPDRPDQVAFANLRNALSNLRTAIGDRHATPSFLQITRETIRFDPTSDHWLDVAAFRALVEITETDRSAHERLEEAVALYRGDFMQGFFVHGSPEFENWALLVRERLQRQVLDALRRLVAHYESNGDVARGNEVAWRWAELAPWEEEAHRRLMRLLARNGQRGAALAQYEACRQILAQELGVEPGPETAALYEQIRDGDLDPVALPHFLRAATADDRLTVTFIARECELAQLDGYLTEALAGQGRIVFITGEAGTGKTALAGAFGRRAQAEHAGLVVAGGNCNAYTGTGDPYLPFREILGQLSGDVESRWAAGALSTEGARRLWNLMPLTIQSLVERGPDLLDTLLAASPLVARAATAAPGGTEWRDRLERLLATGRTSWGQPGLRQVDLYAQVTALLIALAQEHPLLLTLDDLQWADAGTIDLLFHLGRRLAGSRILIAGIYRPSEVAVHRVDGRHPLAPVLRELQRQFGHTQIHLFQTGYRQFVESLLDSEPNRLGPDFREALYRHTQGHALCTVETLREMRERGDLVRDGAGRWIEGPAVDWASLPARCEGVIGERVERLPAALREALKVASVEGETFTAEIVARVQGASELEVIAQLSDQLDRRHRLIVSEGSQSVSPGGRRISRYRFRHIMFQEYIYSNLDEAERGYLHEAVGNALEQVYAGQTEAMAVQLAWHYDAAERMDKAGDYYLRAGNRARELYAYAEAGQHYARALEVLTRLPDKEEVRRQRVDTLLALSLSAWRTDSLAHSLARLAEAEWLAQELPGPEGMPGGDPLRLARIRFWMGRAHVVRGSYNEAVRYYRQALAVAQASGDDASIALFTSAIGQATSQQGRFGEAEALLRQVLPLLKRSGNESEWFRALGFHGVNLTQMGRYAEGLAEIQRACAWAEEREAATEISQGYHFLTAAYAESGDWHRSVEAGRQAIETVNESGGPVYLYVGYIFHSWAACYAGQYAAALASVAQAQRLVEDTGEPLIHGDWLAAIHALSAFGAGRIQEAIALAERAVNVAQEVGGIVAEAMARRAWGQALAALETPQWDEAEAQLAHSLRLLESGECRLEAARTNVAWGTVCRDRGDLAGARAHWEQAAAQWEKSGLNHELVRTRALMESLASE